MKKRMKKLNLNRETLRNLPGEAMERARGGGPFQDSYQCTGDCETQNATCLTYTLGGGATCFSC